VAGGFEVSKPVYFIGGNHTFANGNRLMYGHQVTVVGMGDSDDEVALQMVGNEGRISVLPTLVRSPRAALTLCSRLIVVFRTLRRHHRPLCVEFVCGCVLSRVQLSSSWPP
jgi:hypothetical protein